MHARPTSCLRAQLLTVELVVLVAIFVFIFAVLYTYYWAFLRHTENTLNKVTLSLLLKNLGKELAYLFASGKSGSLQLYVPPGDLLETDYYSLYIINSAALGQQVYVNSVPNTTKGGIAFVNASQVNLSAAPWQKFVGAGGELVLYVPDSAVNATYSLLVKAAPELKQALVALDPPRISGLAVLSPIYYAPGIYLQPFRNYTGPVYFALNSSAQWKGIEIIEYVIYNNTIYLLAFKVPYGLGSILVVTDPWLYRQLARKPVLAELLGENIKYDPSTDLFYSKYRKIINPYTYPYSYFIFACHNLLIFTQGFAKVAVYKVRGVSSRGLNASLYYQAYTAGVLAVPLPGCGGYYIRSTAPAKVFAFSGGGFLAVTTQHAVLPASHYIIVCGRGATVTINFLAHGGSVYFRLPSVFAKCYWINISSALHSNYALAEIIASAPVTVYFDLGALQFDSIYVPPVPAGSKVVYYVPRLRFFEHGKEYYYWMLVYSVIDNLTRSYTLMDGSVTPVGGKKILFYATKKINYTDLDFYLPQGNAVQVVASPGVKVLLFPIIYNASTGKLDVNSNIVNGFGALYLLDSFIFLPLLTSSKRAAQLYSLAVYTSAPNLELLFMAFNLSYVPLLDVYNLSASQLSNFLGHPKIYRAHVGLLLYYCKFNNGNKLFLLINNSFLAQLELKGSCKCYNGTGYSTCSLAKQQVVSLRSTAVYYLTAIIKGATL
ncbi:MAG: hypothetical protein GXO42_02895 [bacterium]|nr:hypothetical protein [bacterium]